MKYLNGTLRRRSLGNFNLFYCFCIEPKYIKVLLYVHLASIHHTYTLHVIHTLLSSYDVGAGADSDSPGFSTYAGKQRSNVSLGCLLSMCICN
jgi:hypothetical protein